MLLPIALEYGRHITVIFMVRTSWGKYGSLTFAPLNHEHILRKISRLTPKVLNFGLILIPELVKAQAVFFRVYYCAQFRFQASVLCRIQQTLKHGTLHSLTIIDALPGNLSEPFPPGGVFGIDIVRN